MFGIGPVVVWNHYAVDEQDAREAEGTIVVLIAFAIDDCWADPGRDLSTSMIRERLAGLSAPAGLLLLHTLEELRDWLWTGDCDCWIEVHASCGVLFHMNNDSFDHLLGQLIDVREVTMNCDSGRSIIVPFCIHN